MVNTASIKNLKPFAKGSAGEYGKRGGKASAKIRRERKLARELLADIVAMSATELDEAALESLGIEANDRNQLAVMLVAILRKAQGGDIRAAELVLSLLGELPPKTQEIAMQEEAPQSTILILPDNGRDGPIGDLF